MPRLINNVRKLAEARRLNRRQFEGLCYGEGISIETARDAWNGKTNINTETVAVISRVLNVPMHEIIVMVQE